MIGEGFKNSTVVIKFGVKEVCFQLDSLCVRAGITEHVPVGDIVALGCLRGNHEWHVTLATQAAKDVLLEVGRVNVRGPNQARRTGYIDPLVPLEVFVRVLWVPAWISSRWFSSYSAR